MEQSNIQELQSQSVAKITERLPSLDRAALVELAALEAATTAPRVTLQEAIDKQLATLDESGEDGPKDPPAVVDSQGEPAAQAAGKLAVTDYRHRDYAGALTGEQAAWRVHNIKPVEKVRTK